MGTEKVVNIFDQKVYKEIMMFLDEKKEMSNSERTVDAYLHDINEFFQFIRGKNIEYLTIEDIQIPNDDLRLYKNHLKNDLGNSMNTIFRKFASIRVLYKYFYTYDLVKEDSLKTLDKVKTQHKPKQNPHGNLTVSEIFQMADLVMKQKGGRKKRIKYFLILTALDTCLRKTALLNLRWNDFDVRDDYVIVNAIDKGNKHFRPKISKEFYNQLLEIKDKDEEKVFNITSDSIQQMMNYLVKEMGFPKERNIKFHSIRKGGITYQYRVSGGDILQAKKAANHSSIATTELYLSEQDYGIVGAVSSKGKIDDTLFEKVTHEELLEGIRSLNNDQKLLLNIKLNEIINIEKR